MSRQQLINALRTDLKSVRRACGDRVANHFTINGMTFYLKEISKIEFSDSAISLYVKNSNDNYNHLITFILYDSITSVG